jgi:dipeptidyl aminopeptidase/acylaminoacyl peptidase
VPLRNSERILEAFKGAGVATDLVVIAGGKHGFEGEDAVVARRAMVDWFEQHLGGQPVSQTAPTGR